MAEVKPPDWLPDGWIMEVWVDDKNKKDLCYKCPESGETFMSKKSVLCYLSRCSPPAKELNDARPPAPHQKVIDWLNWMPSGWFIEIRVPNGATKAGQRYECYIDRSTGIVFRSKEDVLHFLRTGECHNSVSHKGNDKSEMNYYVLMQIEYSPSGLPPGWIKEIRFRDQYRRQHRDCFYTDPVSGYLFRSLKDVLRYAEDGILSKRAFLPKAGSIYNLHALAQESHGHVKHEPRKIRERKKSSVSPSLDCRSSQGHKKKRM